MTKLPEQSAIAQIKKYAHITHPHECCGVVVQGEVKPLENVHPHPEDNFLPDAATFFSARVQGIDYLFHSHTKLEHPGTLTPSDIQQSKVFGIPYLLYHTQSGVIDYYDPASLNPWPLLPNPHHPKEVDFYLGRRYEYSRSDCYGIFRDMYRGILNIELDDFPRGDSEEWMQPGWNAYRSNFPKQGFVEVSDEPLRQWDVFLMRLEGPNPHHVGVLVDVEKRHFVHHLNNHLSRRSVWGSEWERCTVARYRHVKIAT